MLKKLCPGLLVCWMLVTMACFCPGTIRDAIAGPAQANPCRATLADIQKSVATIKRIDDAGSLYTMHYLGKYDRDDIKALVKKMAGLDVGCSAFMTYNTDGDVLVGRNYDYAHRDKNGNVTGQQLVIKCTPEKGYASLATVDTFWLDAAKGTFVRGTLDDGRTDLSALVVTPYACVDGMNEKGLTASTLKLNLKEGETPTCQNDPGKSSTMISILLRCMLDTCATVDEAVAVAQQYNMQALKLGPEAMEIHLFITDANGKSAVLEWRYNKLHVIYTDVVTNFFVGFDDAEDYVKNGKLREKAVRLDNTDIPYHYGYGHGFHRFTGIVSALERYIHYNTADHRKIMSEAQAKTILQTAAQDLDVEETSMTQTSILFNAQKRTATYWIWQQYDKPYVLTLD